MQISTALQAKAERLVNEDHVQRMRNLVYVVEGDSDTYVVELSYPQEASGRCNCKSTAEVCSHILAASIVYLTDPPLVSAPTTDPFEGIN